MSIDETNGNDRFYRRLVRLAMTGLAGLLGSGVILGVVQSNVQEWAKANKQDQYLVKYAGPILEGLAQITQSPTFLAIAWAGIGGAAILWIDYAIRRRTKMTAIVLYFLAACLVGLATWILLNPRPDTQSAKPDVSDAERSAIAAPFLAQIDALKKQLAAPPSPATSIFLGGGPSTESPEKKEYTTRTVRELLSLYDGKTAFQADKLMDPYKGMWIETDGKIVGLYPDGEGAVAAIRNGGDSIECRFSSASSRALGRYNNGEELKVRGKISTTQNGQQLYLLYCEVIS